MKTVRVVHEYEIPRFHSLKFALLIEGFHICELYVNCAYGMANKRNGMRNKICNMRHLLKNWPSETIYGSKTIQSLSVSEMELCRWPVASRCCFRVSTDIWNANKCLAIVLCPKIFPKILPIIERFA